MGSLRLLKSKRIYVRFTYADKQREEPTGYYCTGKGGTQCKCKSCQSARAILYSVERKIRENTFKYEEFFPDSRAVASLGIISVSKEITFGEYADRWYNSLSLQPSTMRSYSNHVKKLSIYFGKARLKDIVPMVIKEYKKTLEQYSAKYQKHILVTFSTILESAKNDRLIDVNPMSFVPKPKVSAKKADPFFLDEVKTILEYTQKHYPHMALFFATGFFMGLREGEIMGLKWGDFDFTKNMLRVQRTITDGKIKESTKTAEYRDIPIPEIMLGYIQNHKQYTMLKSEWVFVNKYNTPFMSYNTINKYYWRTTLLACKLRYREVYQMRHSFACNALASGFELSYVQMMLGHSSLEMIFKVYGNYIPQNNPNNGFKISHFWGNLGETKKSII